jgi:hypothetical protein
MRISDDGSGKHPLRNRWRASAPAFLLVSGLLTVLVYLGVAWFVLSPHVLWSPDEGAKLLQLQNLRFENHVLAYDIAYNGQKLDPDLRFAPVSPTGRVLRVRDGALYLQRFPVFPLFVLPLFRTFGWYGLYLLPALGGALSGIMALALVDRGDRRLGMWVLIAFGSPLFVYSTIFWEHTLAAGLGLGGAWLALRTGSQRQRSLCQRILGWAAVGIMLSMSIFLRLEMAIFALALLAAYWFVVRHDRWAPVAVVMGLGAALLVYGLLHLLRFGQIVPDNALYLYYPFAYLKGAQWRALTDLLVGPPVDEAIDPGWLGVLWAIAAIVAIAHSFGSKDARAVRNLRIGALGVTAMAAMVFLFSSTPYRSAHGLLFTTPWAIVGLCRAREVWQRGNWRARVVVLTMLIGLTGYTIAIIGFRGSSPHGGLEWGARLAIVFYPLLAIVAWWDLGSWRSDWKALVIVGVLSILGVGFQIRGILTIQHDKRLNGELNQVITEVPEPYVISDLWWVPLNAAPVYNSKAMLVVPTADTLASWLELPENEDLQQFSLVTLNGSFPYDVARTLSGRELSVINFHRVGNIWIFHVEAEPSSRTNDLG